MSGGEGRKGAHANAHMHTHIKCIGVHLWITVEARGQCHMYYPVTPLPYF